MNKIVMWLDRRRTFRLTPETAARERELAGMDPSGVRQVAGSLWLFMIHEDPDPTLEEVEKILRDFLCSDPLGIRHRQLSRLRTRLGAMLQQYLAKEK